MDLKVHKELKVLLEALALLEIKAHKDLEVLRELKEHKAPKV